MAGADGDALTMLPRWKGVLGALTRREEGKPRRHGAGNFGFGARRRGKRNGAMGGYFTGLDLGQSRDYTALTAAERTEGKGEWDPVQRAHRKTAALAGAAPGADAAGATRSEMESHPSSSRSPSIQPTDTIFIMREHQTDGSPGVPAIAIPIGRIPPGWRCKAATGRI